MSDVLAFLLWLESQLPGSTSTALICPDGGDGGTDGGTPPTCS